MDHRTLFFAFCSFFSILVGCTGTEVTINQQPVYTPPVAGTVTNVADTNLSDCINQTLADQNISQPSQLTRLICTSAGIEDLAGIEQLKGLVQLDLNQNAVSRVAPLWELKNLKQARLTNNPNLACNDLDRLVDLRGPELELLKPEHCS